MIHLNQSSEIIKDIPKTPSPLCKEKIRSTRPENSNKMTGTNGKRLASSRTEKVFKTEGSGKRGKKIKKYRKKNDWVSEKAKAAEKSKKKGKEGTRRWK